MKKVCFSRLFFKVSQIHAVCDTISERPVPLFFAAWTAVIGESDFITTRHGKRRPAHLVSVAQREVLTFYELINVANRE